MKDTNYAGFWRRFTAYSIDISLITITAYIINKIVIVFQSSVTGGLLFSILFIFLSWLYFTIMESSTRKATYGKIAAGVTVTTLNNERISFWRANARFWGKFVSAIILFFGFIVVGMTSKKQALHDIMAKCLVVKNNEPEFTAKFSIYGITLMIGISILFTGYFHYQLHSKPILPALRSFIVNIHASLGLIAYACVITSLIVSILGVVKVRQIPKIVKTLQIICIFTFTITIILGSFWAGKAWGSMWSWDLKEISTIILLLTIMLPVFLIIRFTVFNWLKVFALTVQLISVIFVLFIVRLLPGLHSYSKILF